LNIIDALSDKRLLGAYLPDLTTWKNWLVFLKSVYSIPLTPDEFDIYEKFTGRTESPMQNFESIYCLSGRKSGKSLICAACAINATLIDNFWIPQVKRGKKVFFPVIAVDKTQAREIFDYAVGFLHASPLLRSQVAKERTWDIEMKNGAVIMIRQASFRNIRGPLFCGAAVDEICFMRDSSSANPDSELVKAILPGILPGGKLICISSVYGRFGIAYEEFRANYGRNDSKTLVWLSDTLSMNPCFSQDKISTAMDKDPSHAKAEYFSVWRDDIESFVTRPALEACIIPNRTELEPMANVEYQGYIDPSSLKDDSFSVAISHLGENETVILDLAREFKPPQTPSSVVSAISGILKIYNIYQVDSDSYACGWVKEAMMKEGIIVNKSQYSASDNYLNFLPLVLNRTVELLDDPIIVTQFTNLERRSRVGGKDLITHYAGTHDDVACAIAGACLCSKRDDDRPPAPEEIARIFSPVYEQDDEEQLARYASNFLLGIRQKPWTAKNDDEDDGDCGVVNKRVYDGVFRRLK
jgi:hypothetical protein